MGWGLRVLAAYYRRRLVIGLLVGWVGGVRQRLWRWRTPPTSNQKLLFCIRSRAVSLVRLTLN
ncbi:MAG: hypothetical protein N3E49_08935 [Bacteroidia bacterium]|nr:hypothetical protein [Bacteroidia bacterium]